MKTPARIPTVLAVLAAASIAFAGDAKTYKLAVGDHWKVGQTATRTQKDTDHQALKVEMKDGTVVKDDTSETTTTYVRVEKCAEVDTDGHWAKGLVYFSEWSQTKGEAKDESLKGVVIELSGAGNAHAWKTVSEGAAPSDAAKAWFDTDMGPESDHDKGAAIMDPKKEVAVGETWTPDMAAFVEMMSKKLPIDGEKAVCKITLKAVEGPLGTLEMDFTLPTKGMPTPQGSMLTWTEGGTMTLKGQATQMLDGTVGAGKGAMDFVLKGVASEANTGTKITLDVSGHKEGSGKAGGEIPTAPPK